MTLQLRPTFSESWYRVAPLRAKLRASAQISRQYYRGERWYVVRDPAGNQFHRLSDPAYRFVGLLDGSRTVEEAWDLAGGQLADDAPTQPEVIQILSHLYSANLIDADVTPDATVLLRRHKQLTKRKMQNRFMNVLFPRIPLWDPDRFLVRWMPLARLLLSRFGAVVWLLVVGAAVAMIAPHWNATDPHSLKKAAADAINIRHDPINLVLLWGVFVGIKAIHELGHAFSCRRFGGECHELGIMFLVFIPTPYVDASSAWSFPNKWHRIFVGAAGMIVELFFASLCAFIWVSVDPTSLIGRLTFNAMLVASVTTVVFNANPLLRYDGYYILSDFLEIPNLRQKSSEYALGLIKRHLFRVKLQQPLPPILQRFWLLTYAILSGIYRTFIGIAIILLVAFQIPVLGILMALGGVITWVAVPAYKTFKYLAIEPELHRKRGRAAAYTVAFVVAVIVLVGLIKFPLHLDAVGVVEPTNREFVVARTGGFVTKIGTRPDGTELQDGDWVRPGDVIAVCSSPELDAEIAQKKAERQSAVAKYEFAVAQGTDAVAPLAYAIQTIDLAIADRMDRKNRLTLRATAEGQLVAPELHELVGRFIQGGQEIAMVAKPDQLTVHVLAEQKDVQPIVNGLDGMRNVVTEIRFAGDVLHTYKGGHPQEYGMAQEEARSASLTSLAGTTDVPTDPKDPKKFLIPQFDIGVPLENPDNRYVIGQRAYVRFTLDKKPLVWQWTRRFWQLIQTKSSSSPWI
jgi:putative peptide zinc metalloprotease protein